MDNMNWDKMEQDAVQATSVSAYDTNAKTLYFKCKPGIHKLRILPTGNKLDNLPYMKTAQHVFRIPMPNAQPVMQYVLCWNYLMENLHAIPSVEDKKTKSLLSYLTRMGKLAKPEMDKFNEYGCPFCKGFAHLDAHGVEREEKSKLYPKESWYWNVLWRQTPTSGDNKLYVWTITKSHFNSLITAIRQDKAAGYFTLDPDKGFDLSWQATGEGLGRRYNAPMFDRIPTPLNLAPTDIPWDLAEIVCQAFKSYQDQVNILKQVMGQRLQMLGYVIPGDIAVHTAYAGREPVQAEQYPFTQQQAMQQAPPIHQVPSMQQPIPVGLVPEKKDVGGGFYTINGKLYDPNGKELF